MRSRAPCARVLYVTSKQAAELYARAGAIPPPDIASPSASKYNARKKLVDGILFDSTGEAEAYRLLKLWESAGRITELELQPRFLLIAKSAIQKRARYYVADFAYRDLRTMKTMVIDFKGIKTPVFKLKLAILLERYPDLNFEIWTRATLRSL